MKFTKAIAVITTAGLIVGAGASAASANYAPKVNSIKVGAVKKTKVSTVQKATINVSQTSVRGLTSTVVAKVGKKTVGSAKVVGSKADVTLKFPTAGKYKVVFTVSAKAKGQKTSSKSVTKTITVGKTTKISSVKTKRSGKTVTLSGKSAKKGIVYVQYKIGKKSYKKAVRVSAKGTFTYKIKNLKKKSSVKISYKADKNYFATKSVSVRSK